MPFTEYAKSKHAHTVLHSQAAVSPPTCEWCGSLFCELHLNICVTDEDRDALVENMKKARCHSSSQ